MASLEDLGVSAMSAAVTNSNNSLALNFLAGGGVANVGDDATTRGDKESPEPPSSQMDEQRFSNSNTVTAATDGMSSIAATAGTAGVDAIMETLVNSLKLEQDLEAGGGGAAVGAASSVVSGDETALSIATTGAATTGFSAGVTAGPNATEPKSLSSRSSSLAGNMFTDAFESVNGGGSLEDSCSSLGDGIIGRNCKKCSSRLVTPRVLSCLHVFCEPCLQQLLTDGMSSASSTSSSLAGDLLTSSQKSLIECPTCKQVTTVGTNGVESLTCDYILTNILDLSTIESEQLSCTSCKSKEQAISRCSDCANFLCGGCDNAHKYMRCFENHEVVRLEDLQKATTEKSLAIHKPMLCNVHVAENLKYYCFNCQIPVCNDCLIADHKGGEHHYDVIASAETTVRGDIENLMKEAKSKVQYCDAAAANLSSALTELQTQHDVARDLIEHTYQSYRKVLEKCRDQALDELDKLHSERELKIMDLLQHIENTMGKIDGTCQFATRVLDQANAAEFLSMKKLISAQFINLINNTPKCDINYSLTFDTKAEKFQQLAHDTFGKFRTESTPPSPKESTPPPTLPGMPPPLMDGRSGISCSGNSQSQLANSVTASSPISLPTSMQSSFDGDLSVLGNGFMMPNVMTSESPPQQQLQQQHQGGGGGMHHQLHSQSQQQQQQQHNHHHQQTPGGAQAHAQQTNDVHVFNGMVNGGLGAGSLNGLMGASSGGSVNVNGLNNNMSNGLANQLNGLNGLSNGLSNGLNGGGINGNLNGGSNGGAAGVPPTYNSILEYNLSRLASLTENTPDTLNDALVPSGGNGGASHHQTGGPSLAPNQPITLADILSGDQRAFNNLQALAKLGLNDFQNDLISNQLLSGGDCLLPDFCLPTATSPVVPGLVGGPNSDDMNHVFHVPTSPAGSNNAAIVGRNKATPMQIRCKFGSLGTSKGQFNSPHGFCLGVDEEIIVADTNNHRIEVFDKTGTLKFQFGVPGKEEGQLWYPRKVAVMHTNGKFVVCDRGNERSRMQIFSKCGHFMRKIAIRYIDIVAGLAVTSKGHIVAVDSVSPTVFVISEDGELVRWFDCSDYMREPSDIAIRDNDFYVCDFKGHCVAVFQEDGTFQYRIGNEKVTCFPNGIDISNAGDILIGDSHGNRFHVACYSRDGILQSEFECPHVKVSRCCGLKITSEGYVVTLAKNNHHVLVLNTLYVH